MRSIALIASLLVGFPSVADGTLVARNGDDQVRIFDKPCPYASVLRFIPEEKRALFRKADTRVGGQRWFACWIKLDDHYGLIYEDGDKGVIPVSEFKLDDEV